MSQKEYDQLLRVTDEVYESSLDAARWAGALDRLSLFVGGIAADLYITDADSCPFIAFTGISDELMHDYLAYFHDQNDRVKVIQKSSEGELSTDHDVACPDEIARSPYYQDLIFKNGYGWYIGACALNRRDESAFFGIHYTHGVDAYQADHFRRLKLVIPHIRRAAQLQNRLRTSIGREARLAATIDAISCGVVLLNEKAEITHVNLAAERLLSKDRGAFIRNRKVIIEQSDLNRKLERLVLETMERRPVPESTGSAVLIGSKYSVSSLAIVVFPLPLRVSLENSLGAILVITEPFSQVSSAASEIVRTIFDLSPAEAQLVIALANGDTIDSYAMHTSRSSETVRDQLKSAMRKTGVHRQTELVRLILNTTGSLPGSG